MRKTITELDYRTVVTEDCRVGTANLVEVDICGDDDYPRYHVTVDWEDGDVTRVSLREAEELGYWPSREQDQIPLMDRLVAAKQQQTALPNHAEAAAKLFQLGR